VGTIADSINMVIGSTNQALSETASVANMVETASTNTQEKSTEIYNLSIRSKEVVGNVIADFEKSLKDIRLMAQVASESKNAAEQATESTLEALKIVKETVGSMGSIRDTISNTETKIKKLAERSQEIGFIVELIGDISERTHVLSLNAAIQAAIAGDAGRGFAAIAGEIQKLAENTKEATQRIARLVSNIQVETSETIQLVNQTIDKVVNGVQLAEASGSQMTETQNKTAVLAKSVLQISTAIVEHEKATNHMKTGAESLSSTQEDFSTAAQDQLMQARSLLAFARRLKSNVEEFKLN
jgi:twitching motility protein PilJ